MSLTSFPWVLILVLFKKSCCYCITSQYQRLGDDVAWPRSHGFIKTGTHTSYLGISCLVSLGTEGGEQFDLSFLDVRTMFLFLKEYFKLFNSNLTLRQVLYSPANELRPPVNQISPSLFNPFYSVLEVISTTEAVAHVI